MQKKNKIKKITKKQKIILITGLTFCVLFFVGLLIKTPINKMIEQRKKEEKPLIEYEIKAKADEEKYKILVKINGVEGIETVKYKSLQTAEEIEVKCKNKKVLAIDYEVEDQKDYEFKIKLVGKEEFEGVSPVDAFCDTKNTRY